MKTRQDQREISDVPRRHGERLGELVLVASAVLAAYTAVSVGPTSGRAQLPSSDAVGLSLNRGDIGTRVRIALEGEIIDYVGWSWTPGPVNYVGATGVLTQGAGVPFGVAITPTRLLILRTGPLPSVVVLGAQPQDDTLDALAAYNTNGILTQTAADTFVGRTITQSTGITVTNGNGVAGNPTIAIANTITAGGPTGSASVVPVITYNAQGQLTAVSTATITPAAIGAQPVDATLNSLAAYNTNGLLTQTAADTFTGRTLTGTSAEIDVANGNGVSGNPTISLPAAITLTGKNITGGTHTAAAFNGTVGATTPSTIAATTLTMSGAFLLQDAGAVNFDIQSTANTDIAITMADLSSSWSFGLDNSDSNAWVLSSGSALGVNNVLRADAASVSFPVGIDFGSAVVATVGDLSRHIDLFGGTFGLNLTAGVMNIVVPTGGAIGMAVNGSYVLAANGTTVSFPVGADFGSTVAASSTDLSSHLALFSTTYGLNVTSNSLNYVVPTGGAHYLRVDGTTRLFVSAGGADVTGELEVLATSNAPATFTSSAASSASNGSIGYFYCDDGTAMGNGHRLGGLIIGGSSAAGGASNRNASAVMAFATEAWVDASAYGSNLTFETTANGATTRAVRATLTSTSLNLASGVVLQANATQVVSTRKTGWAVATGTPTRTTFVTSTVTLPQLAERVKALIDDLHGTAGHGLIGT